MNIKIVKNKISKGELENITRENFGDMVKVDVDVKKTYSQSAVSGTRKARIS